MATDRFTVEVAASILSFVAVQMQNLDCIPMQANSSQITCAITDRGGILGELCCHTDVGSEAQILPRLFIDEGREPQRAGRWHEYVRRVQALERLK